MAQTANVAETEETVFGRLQQGDRYRVKGSDNWQVLLRNQLGHPIVRALNGPFARPGKQDDPPPTDAVLEVLTGIKTATVEEVLAGMRREGKAFGTQVREEQGRPRTETVS